MGSRILNPALPIFRLVPVKGWLSPLFRPEATKYRSTKMRTYESNRPIYLKPIKTSISPSPSALLPIIDLLARKLKEKCTLSILITGAILVKSVKKKRVLFAHKNITLSVEIPRCIEEPKEKWWKKYKRRDPSERSTKWRSRRFHGIYRPSLVFYTRFLAHRLG